MNMMALTLEKDKSYTVHLVMAAGLAQTTRLKKYLAERSASTKLSSTYWKSLSFPDGSYLSSLQSTWFQLPSALPTNQDPLQLQHVNLSDGHLT